MSAQAGPSHLGQSSIRGSSGTRPHWSHEDVDLSDLVARLSIQDIDELESRQKGKTREGAPLSDAELALSIFAADARALIQYNSDRALAQALSEVEEPQLEFHTNDSVGRDRGNAGRDVRMQPHSIEYIRTQAQPLRRHEPAAPNHNQESWGGMFFSWFFGNPSTSTSLSTKPAITASGTRSALTGQSCVICQDPIRGAQVHAPCGHYYDISCISDLFRAATRDESLFPPRCCRQPIPLTTVRKHLTFELISLFVEREKEFTTLKKVYCANPTCSRFLGPLRLRSLFGNIITCPAPGCLTRTCGSCRAKVVSDASHTCKPDEKDEQVLALSKDVGWARCPGCDQMIELQMGCYHMTCLCKTQFCYLCAARWKTCRCVQWDEQRLITAAEARVDLQYGQEARVALPDARPALAGRALTTRARTIFARHQRPDPPAQVVPMNATIRREPTIQPALRSAPIRNTILTREPADEARPQLTRTNITTLQDTIRAEGEVSVPFVRQLQFPPSRPASTGTAEGFIVRDRQRLIQETVEELRLNHDCLHTSWSYREGGGQCQTCYHQLPIYLFRCSGCQILACNRCRRNRL